MLKEDKQSFLKRVTQELQQGLSHLRDSKRQEIKYSCLIDAGGPPDRTRRYHHHRLRRRHPARFLGRMPRLLLVAELLRCALPRAPESLIRAFTFNPPLTPAALCCSPRSRAAHVQQR